ncbi:hypothetical protein KBW98_18570 [Massilia sp. ST3]|nr:hypothetical protein [Massilia sp. ST3]
MDKLISELRRLYLPADAPPPEALARHLRGEETLAIPLATGEGMARAVVIPFRKSGKHGEPEAHWTRLCAAANALQQELDLPAPAVSIGGDGAYGLWLSLEQPAPVAQLAEFVTLLRAAWFPEAELDAGRLFDPVELPPCLHRASGKWAAFIHPGMGASFADEAGLDMAPPPAGQAAFLEGLERIGPAQFLQALARLRPSAPSPSAGAPAPAPRAAAAEGLLLKDATLEDIVAHLHALNIEPTFRHILPR